MNHLSVHITNVLFRSQGQTMTETAVILALIVLIAMVGVAIFSSGLQALWENISQTLPNG